MCQTYGVIFLAGSGQGDMICESFICLCQGVYPTEQVASDLVASAWLLGAVARYYYPELGLLQVPVLVEFAVCSELQVVGAGHYSVVAAAAAAAALRAADS